MSTWCNRLHHIDIMPGIYIMPIGQARVKTEQFLAEGEDRMFPIKGKDADVIMGRTLYR